jgi:hypothetical protein
MSKVYLLRLVSFILFTFALKAASETNTVHEPVSLGKIQKLTAVDMEIPEKGRIAEYTYVPTQGQLAGKPIVLTLKRITRHYTKGSIELISLRAQTQGTRSVFIVDIFSTRVAKRLADLHPYGQISLNPEGNLVIQGPKKHDDITFDVPAKLTQLEPKLGVRQ